MNTETINETFPVVLSTLEIVTAAKADVDAVAAGLDDLEKRYKGVVYDVTTPAGMKQATEARDAIREPRGDDIQ